MASQTMVLSPLDWLMPGSYIGQVMCFPSNGGRVHEVLGRGIRGLARDLPYLLGGITDRDHPKGSVELTEPYQAPEDLLSYQDISEALDYAALKAEGFPPEALSLPGIRPPDALPPYSSPAPVFRARLSFIRGGFLLYVAVHHRTTDITGYGTLLSMWAAHCRTGSSADTGFNPSWLDRGALLSSPAATGVRDVTEMPEFVHALNRNSLPRPAENFSSQPPEYETRVFHFSAEYLRDTKEAVNKEKSLGSLGVDWVSTGDILTAILWSATLWAERDALDITTTATTATAAIPVNFRSRYSRVGGSIDNSNDDDDDYNSLLPGHYLGAAFVMALASLPQRDVLSPSDMAAATANARGATSAAAAAPLARVAAVIRCAILRVSRERVAAALVHLAALPDMTTVALAPVGRSMSLVSWADEGVCELEWGFWQASEGEESQEQQQQQHKRRAPPATMMGRCEAVRLPKMPGRRNPIVLPRLRDGSLEVIASFERGMMERFGQNPLVRGAY
ncbi:hypothetical protein BX600DRAFT_504582 [Xylariales sp. PMI_506]|nr:hypothetical protein BX600DRAFT_504582 [Xylariales sp. PMI_506]